MRLVSALGVFMFTTPIVLADEFGLGFVLSETGPITVITAADRDMPCMSGELRAQLTPLLGLIGGCWI